MSNSASNRSKSEFLLMPNPLQVGERLDNTSDGRIRLRHTMIQHYPAQCKLHTLNKQEEHIEWQVKDIDMSQGTYHIF